MPVFVWDGRQSILVLHMQQEEEEIKRPPHKIFPPEGKHIAFIAKMRFQSDHGSPWFSLTLESQRGELTGGGG